MNKKLTKLQGFRQNSFGFLIHVISRRINKNVASRLSELDLDLKSFANLMELNEKDGISQRELGSLIDFPEYTTSRVVDSMSNKGLLERHPDPNSRRSVCIYLTPKGKKIAAQMPKIVSDSNKISLDKLSDTESTELLRLLRKVVGIPKDGDPSL